MDTFPTVQPHPGGMTERLTGSLCPMPSHDGQGHPSDSPLLSNF